MLINQKNIFVKLSKIQLFGLIFYISMVQMAAGDEFITCHPVELTIKIQDVDYPVQVGPSWSRVIGRGSKEVKEKFGWGVTALDDIRTSFEGKITHAKIDEGRVTVITGMNRTDTSVMEDLERSAYKNYKQEKKLEKPWSIEFKQAEANGREIWHFYGHMTVQLADGRGVYTFINRDFQCQARRDLKLQQNTGFKDDE